MNDFNARINNLTKKGYSLQSENIKILIYKLLGEKIFEKIDINDDKVFMHPFVFSTINEKINVEDKINYLLTGEAKVSWLYINQKNNSYIIDNRFKVFTDFSKLFQKHFYDEFGNQFQPTFIQYEKPIYKTFEKTLQILEQCNSNFSKLIERYTPYFTLFTDTTLKRNSFADASIQGLNFFNVFQEEYDEVFFLDDISHQCSHSILNLILNTGHDFFNEKKDIVAENIYYEGKIVENRNLFVVFHALFTYYNILTTLNSFVKNEFYDNETQKLEALGRIKFYLRKMQLDLKIIEDTYSKYNCKTEISGQFLVEYNKLFHQIGNKWKSILQFIDLSEQPYNFTNKIFYEKNNHLLNNHSFNSSFGNILVEKQLL